MLTAILELSITLGIMVSVWVDIPSHFLSGSDMSRSATESTTSTAPARANPRPRG